MNFYHRDPDSLTQTLKVVKEAKQERRRQEKIKIVFLSNTSLKHTLRRRFYDLLRLIRDQQRQVSKVLLEGLYDPDSPISKLLGVRAEIMGEIIWQMLVENWQIFPDQ